MDAGKLRIVVGRDGAQRLVASIASSRRLAARALSGQPADAAVALVPRLFSLCSTAQGVAARQALAAARGLAGALPSAAELRALACEAIGEHLWRLCLDWPRLLGTAVRLDDFRRWRQRLIAAAAVDDPGLASDLLAALPALRPAVLPQQRTAASCGFLPWLDAKGWAEAGIDENFSVAPHWQGRPAETGALARRFDEAEVADLVAGRQLVAARIVARLADLRALAGGLRDPQALAGWCSAALPSPGTGLARVETARGLLLHLMQVNDGRVVRYVIVAPTEWNFHPQGVFVSELAANEPASDENMLDVAQRLALALDPCVNYEVVVDHA